MIKNLRNKCFAFAIAIGEARLLFVGQTPEDLFDWSWLEKTWAQDIVTGKQIGRAHV